MYEPQDGRDYEAPGQIRHYSEDGGSEASTMDRAREQADEMKEQAGEQFNTVREQAGEQMEHGRERMAEGAQTAADRMRGEAEDRGGVQGKVGLKAADTMESAAGYLRDHKTDEIWADVERYARDHPMHAVGGAVLAGFVLGRILR
jgi:ElaB/YqjD/DUF883 family membrane-anchored ribosome-binding protein